MKTTEGAYSRPPLGPSRARLVDDTKIQTFFQTTKLFSTMQKKSLDIAAQGFVCRSLKSRYLVITLLYYNVILKAVYQIFLVPLHSG